MAHTAAQSTSHGAHDIRAHVRTYLMIFGTLMVLTIVTVAVSYLHLPHTEAVIVALAIATTKASLVAMFFMHLKGAPANGARASVYRLAIIVALFVLAVLLGLALTDYTTRIRYPAQWQVPQSWTWNSTRVASVLPMQPCTRGQNVKS